MFLVQILGRDVNELLKKSALEWRTCWPPKRNSVELTQACLDRIDASTTFSAVDRGRPGDRGRRGRATRGRTLHRLSRALPIAVKDNVVTRGLRTTCTPRITGDWEPPYDMRPSPPRLETGLPIVGKTSMN